MRDTDVARLVGLVAGYLIVFLLAALVFGTGAKLCWMWLIWLVGE